MNTHDSDPIMRLPIGKVMEVFAHDHNSPDHFSLTCACGCGMSAVVILAKGAVADQLMAILKQHTAPRHMHG